MVPRSSRAAGKRANDTPLAPRQRKQSLERPPSVVPAKKMSTRASKVSTGRSHNSQGDHEHGGVKRRANGSKEAFEARRPLFVLITSHAHDHYQRPSWNSKANIITDNSDLQSTRASTSERVSSHGSSRDAKERPSKTKRWSSSTDMVLPQPGHKLALILQSFGVQAVARAAIALLQLDFVFLDAFPDRQAKSQYARRYLIKAARKTGEDRIEARLCKDDKYAVQMSSLVVLFPASFAGR